MNKCARCDWPLLDGNALGLCPECQRVELFKLAASIAAKAILSEKNFLLRLRLIRKFFGVCVNVWETQSILGPVLSAARR
jgi:hypothetical protein